MAIINLRTCRRSTLDKVLEVYKMFKSGMERKDIRSHMDMTIVSINSYIQTCESDQYKDYVKELLEDGISEEKEPELKVMPQSGVRSYILTSAQNDTEVPDALWKNIQAFASFTSSKILITPMVYGNRKTHDIFDNRIKDYLTRDRVVLSNQCVFYSDCGKFTRVGQNPLSSVDKLLHDAHNAIIPSYKFSTEAIAQPKNKSTVTPVHMYATGTITNSNYKDNKSGKIAENTLQYGAVFVQIDEDGTPYIFDLEASSDYDYSFCWMEFTVQNGVVKKSHDIEAIVYGDIHTHYMDDEHINNIIRTSDLLKPKMQIFHDLHDHYSANHHHVNNIGTGVRKVMEGHNKLNSELRKCSDLLNKTCSKNYMTRVIQSNHDNALTRYMDDKRSMVDYPNFWLNLQLQNIRLFIDYHDNEECILNELPPRILDNDLKDIRDNTKKYALHKEALNLTPSFLEYVLINWYNFNGDNLEFIGTNDELMIANYYLGLHGDIGANGARGSNSLHKTATNFILGHRHTAERRGRLITAGISFPYDRALYATGFSGWSITCALLFSIGTATLLTLKKGKPRAKTYHI